MKNPIRTGTMIALTAASLFAAACSKKEEAPKSAPTEDKAAPAQGKTVPAPEMAAKLHCEGANACKGKGGCKSEKNACKGQNSCKGQGFAETASAEECATKGGTVAEAKM